MKKNIELGADFNINLPTLMETRLLIQANSGGGKSWLLRRLLEQTNGQVQQIVIDLEGEFYTLREKFDYVLVGATGDVPISLRAAALLAQRLLKLKANAIIDLSELQKHERKPFVRLFLEALMEARSPKDYHVPCMVVIDEAHQFAPEKEQSEASAAVIDIMTRGRKRQFCGVLATQRISKLSKDAAAECNNKIVGRCALDLDMKRGAEELGFSTKDEMRTLRVLAPGEFYAFGTALTPEVEKVHSGVVQTSPKPKKSKTHRVIPAPQTAVKAMIKELGDLPKDAETEKKTLAGLEQQVKTLTQQLKQRPVEKVAQVPAAMGVSQWFNYGKERGYTDFFEKKINQAAGLQWEKVVKEWVKYMERVFGSIDKAKQILGGLEVKLPETTPPMWLTPSNLETIHIPASPVVVKRNGIEIPVTVEGRKVTVQATEEGGGELQKGERSVLGALAQYPDGLTRANLTILTSYKRSTRDRYVQYLTQKGYARVEGEKVYATQPGVEALGDFEALPTGSELREKLLRELPEGEGKILRVLCDQYPNAVSRETLTNETNYQRSTRDRYIQYLQARELVIKNGSDVMASAKLFD